MNKHRRSRHLAIRNIQRTDRFGRMTYREARRKHKEGYRAIPVGSGYFTRWFLLNFGSDGLTLTQSRKLGEEYTRVMEHAESTQYRAAMHYDMYVRWFTFRYLRLNEVWQFRLSYEQAIPLIDCGHLAECVTGSAECDLQIMAQCDYVAVSKTSVMAYARAGITDGTVNELAHIRDQMQDTGQRTYSSMPLPFLGGYDIAKTDT